MADKTEEKRRAIDTYIKPDRNQHESEARFYRTLNHTLILSGFFSSLIVTVLIALGYADDARLVALLAIIPAATAGFNSIYRSGNRANWHSDLAFYYNGILRDYDVGEIDADEAYRRYKEALNEMRKTRPRIEENYRVGFPIRANGNQQASK
jgi:hypothetical protein